MGKELYDFVLEQRQPAATTGITDQHQLSPLPTSSTTTATNDAARKRRPV